MRFICICLGATVAGCAVYDVPTADGPDAELPGDGSGIHIGTGGSSGGGGTAATDGEDDRRGDAATTGDADERGAREDVAIVAVPLPFAVDAYFIPTGYMGDGVHPGAIALETSGCKMPRPVGARGSCYKITYKPIAPAMPGYPAWAGVYWLSPQDNWGQKPGRTIQAGAKTVSFYAAGTAGSESVAFRAGGVQDTTQPYHDTFRVEQTQMLATSFTRYSLDLSGQAYDQVIGGFAWIMTTFDAASWAPGAPPIVFYIDDIEWQP